MRERSEKDKMLSGLDYRASDPELVLERRHARRLVWKYAALDPAREAERRALLERLLGHVGERVVIESPLHCDYGWNISLDADVYLNAFCVLLDCAPIMVGAGAQIGPSVQLTTATHPVDPAARAAGLESAAPITIGSNVWIAANVVVGPGVTIGDDSVIGAGSVVLHDVPARVLVVGSPARVVRSL